MFCLVFVRSALAKAATVVAATKVEGAALALFDLGVGSASHCCGVHDNWGRFSGLCSLVRCGLSGTLFAGTTVGCAVLASVRLVGMGSASYCGGWLDR